MNTKRARGLNSAALLIFVIFLFAALWFTNQFDQREKEISWKEFEQIIQEDNVKTVVVNQNKNVPTGRVDIEIISGADEEDQVKYLYVSDVNEIQDYLKEKQNEARRTEDDALRQQISMGILKLFYLLPYDTKTDFYAQFAARMEAAGKN